jgi:hypothetical protein
MATATATTITTTGCRAAKNSRLPPLLGGFETARARQVVSATRCSTQKPKIRFRIGTLSVVVVELLIHLLVVIITTAAAAAGAEMAVVLATATTTAGMNFSPWAPHPQITIVLLFPKDPSRHERNLSQRYYVIYIYILFFLLLYLYFVFKAL